MGAFLARKFVGLFEKVVVIGKGEVRANAIFDTGAKLTSIDTKLAKKAGLGPVIRTQKMKIPQLTKAVERPVVKAKISIKGKVYEAEANLNDRSHMAYPVLIGRNIIWGNFVVDVSKNKKNVRQ